MPVLGGFVFEDKFFHMKAKDEAKEEAKEEAKDEKVN